MLLSSKSSPLISSNFPSPPKTLTLDSSRTRFISIPRTPNSSKYLNLRTKFQTFQVCHDSGDEGSKESPIGEEDGLLSESRNRDGGKQQQQNDWSTSILLFGFWAGLMFYVFKLTPDQTPVRGLLFLSLKNPMVSISILC